MKRFTLTLSAWLLVAGAFCYGKGDHDNDVYGDPTPKEIRAFNKVLNAHDHSPKKEQTKPLAAKKQILRTQKK